MPNGLTHQQQSQYQRDGILFPLLVLSTWKATQFLEHFNDLEMGLDENPKVSELTQMHLYFRWAYNIVKHEKIVDAVEGVLGLNVVARSTSIFSKYPLDPSYISWHQDGIYWGLDSSQVATAWVALSDSTVENSGIPRQHPVPCPKNNIGKVRYDFQNNAP